jgi:predicted phage terminase large subunit-like protein
MAAGILSGITGNRADGVIWDDLVRGRDQADSKTITDKIWDEYVNSLRTRKKPNAWDVGINTRWSENDTPGRILPTNYNGETGWVKGQDGFDWYVVCLPMICEREDDPLGRKLGDMLWPEYFKWEEIEPIQRETRTWSALYQQRPAPESGNFFQSEWFRPYGEGTRLPMPNRATLHVYGASDYAVTDEGGNYTVHIVAGVDPNHDIYILDLWRGRTSPDKWVEVLCDLVQEWRPMGWAEETGQIKSGVGPFLHKRLLERQLYIPRVQFPARGNKQVRATSINGRMGMGKVYFPTAKSWFPELKRELLTFPAGKTDDQVDAMGLLGQVLDRMISGSPYSKEKENNKVLSMDRDECTLTLDDLFSENESKGEKSRNVRIW